MTRTFSLIIERGYMKQYKNRNEVEEKYKFTCPCKKGHIIITQSKDANDKEFKQIFGEFDCKKCEKSYEIVDAMQNDFFLEVKFDVLNF